MAEEEQVSRLKIEISSDAATVKDLIVAIRDLQNAFKSVESTAKGSASAVSQAWRDFRSQQAAESAAFLQQERRI